MTAITVKMRTVKTKTEKQTLLISLIRFWAMGSVVRSDSFMGVLSGEESNRFMGEESRSDAKSKRRVRFWE